MKPGFLCIKTRITSTKRYLRYVKAVEKLLPKFNGQFVARSRPVELLEGDEKQFEDFQHVTIQFPNLDFARSFWYSEDYDEVKKLRKGAGDVHVMLTESFYNEDMKISSPLDDTVISIGINNKSSVAAVIRA